MANLFERQGLLNDVGLIKERWDQEGSTLINISTNNSNPATLYTVTAGKVLFITDIVYNNTNNLGGNSKLADGGAGGTTKLQFFETTTPGIVDVIKLKSPIKFETDIYNIETTPSSSFINLSGWEEPA